MSAGAIAFASLDDADGALPRLAGVVGLVGLVVLAAVLVTGWRGGLGAALALLGAGYLAHVMAGGRVVPEVLASVSVLLLLAGELGQWSLDRRLRGSYELRLEVSRGAGIAWLAVLGAGVAVLGLVVTGIPVPGGVAAQAAAITAAVVLLALVASVARAQAGADGSRRD